MHVHVDVHVLIQCCLSLMANAHTQGVYRLVPMLSLPLSAISENCAKERGNFL